MRALRVALTSLLLPVLTSCISGQMGEQDNLGMQTEYFSYLQQEYSGLAEFAATEMTQPQDAEYFTQKAETASKHIPVFPERPDRRRIPDFAHKDLREGYNQLLNALQTMFSPENGPLLAMAQTRYDCWVLHQEDFPTQNARLACRDGFYEAMANLVPPERNNYEVFFDPASTMLSESSMDTVRSVANKFRSKEGWQIVLAGFADGKGSKAENKTLSLRRAVAVRNALAQQGVSPDFVLIKAEGAPKKKDDPSGRRVAISFHVEGDVEGAVNPDDLAPGWEHSGDI